MFTQRFSLRILAVLSSVLWTLACQNSATDAFEITKSNPEHDAVQIFVVSAHFGLDCAQIGDPAFDVALLGPPKWQNGMEPFYEKETLVLSVDALPAYQKHIIAVFIKDAEGELRLTSCLDNVEVEQGKLRDVHLFLEASHDHL